MKEKCETGERREDTLQELSLKYSPISQDMFVSVKIKTRLKTINFLHRLLFSF